jgi:uncharacterized protein (TIGR02099 family)
MSTRILRLISHFAVYAIGAGVLVAAVLVTTVRMVLPDIGVYRNEVEAWVGSYMGYPVAIRSMEASWQGWVPNLSLRNIDILNSAGTRAITHFASARIAIDPVATLLARHIVPQQLVVSGFDVSIVRRKNGAIFIQEINMGTDPGANTERSELADWLFRQERIRIERGTVKWTDNLHGQEPILLTNVTLTLRSDGSRLQVDGSTSLPPAYGKNMDFALDASGDLLTSSWSGEFYLSANDINPDNWYRNIRPTNINIEGGSADVRIWSHWANARLASLQGELAYRDFVAHVDKARLRVDQLTGSFGATLAADQQWQLGLRIHKLETENGAWPEADVRIEAEALAGSGSTRHTVTFSYLKLADVVPLVLALPRAEGTLAEKWQRVRVNGELQNGLVSFGDGNLTYNLGFHGLGIGGVEALPAIENASGRLRGNLAQARVEFRNDAMTLGMPRADSATLALNGLQGTLVWERSGTGWQIATDALTLHSPDASVQVSGRIVQETGSDQGPFLDISTHAGPADARAALAYLPLRRDNHLRQWLAHSVMSGRMLSGDLILRGNLGDFPFRHREGRFAALVNAEDVTLDYSDIWPPIDGLSGEIEFDGPELVVRTTGGQVFNAAFADATARIPDIRALEKRLLIDGNVSGHMDDLELFVEQSPLSADPILPRVTNSLVDGEMDMKLALSLPLGGVGAPAEVSGRLQISNARLNSGLPNLALQKVSGAVDFTRHGASGTGIQAQFHGQRVEVAVFGDRDQPAEPPRVEVRGTGDDKFIRERLEEFFPGLTTGQPELFSRLRGTTDWIMSVSFADTDGDGKLNRRVAVRSDLTGMAVDLPAPLGKNASDPADFTLVRVLDTPHPGDVEVRYGGRIVAGFSPRPAPNQPLAVGVEFGDPESAPHSAAGIRVAGTLDTLPVTEWWDVLRAVRDAQVRHGGLTPLDISAAGQVRQLLLLGQEFHDVEVGAERADTAWNFQLHGAEIDGQISIPGAANASQPIQVDLERLKIARNTEPGTRRTPDPRAQLPLQVSVADLDFHGHSLGAMKLTSSHVADGMKIDNVEFTQPGLAINGSGAWLRQGAEDQSHFVIKVNADAIDDMLQTFGYNVAAVRKGKTQLDIDAGWAGTPMAFSWENLNGSLHMQVHKGQLLDIEPKAGRLFGLLSFQSLPRRLSLDFSDLFGKGMAFDRIEGTFDITGGNAFTNDLHLRGPSADVAIAGRTGLAVQDYDQIVTVTPQVTGSLPVAGALFGPVGIGVGAVIYLAGEIFDSLTEGIDDLLRYQYTVTGSWDNPVIEKIDNKDKGNG